MGKLVVPPLPTRFETSGLLGYWFGIVTAKAPRRKFLIWLPATNWDHQRLAPRLDVDCPFQLLSEAFGWPPRWANMKHFEHNFETLVRLSDPAAAQLEASRLTGLIVPQHEWATVDPETWRAELLLLDGAGI